jgi:formylglycine-generating enzyme required for sulfatase activity
LFATAIVWMVVDRYRQSYVAGLVTSLETAELTQVRGIVDKLSRYRRRAEPLFREKLRQQPPAGEMEQLRTRLALFSFDRRQAPYLISALLAGPPIQFRVVRELLADGQASIADELWTIVQDEDRDRDARFRAACALRSFTSAERRLDRLKPHADWLAEELVRACAEHPDERALWILPLRPIRDALWQSLFTSFNQRDASAASVLSSMFDDVPEKLTQLILASDPQQFITVLAKARPFRQQVLEPMISKLNRTSREARQPLAVIDERSVASGAMALVEFGKAEPVLDLLRAETPATIRNTILHAFHAYQISPRAIVRMLDTETDPHVVQNLLLSLGAYAPAALPPTERNRVTNRAIALREHSRQRDRAVADWLLHQWQPSQIVSSPRNFAPEQEEPTVAGVPGNSYQNNNHHTMVVLGPAEFQMGSPEGEPFRSRSESPHVRRIARQFAIASTETTVRQWKAFDEEEQFGTPWSSTEQDRDKSVVLNRAKISVTWHEAVQYCNWLSAKCGIAEDQWCYEMLPVPEQNVEDAKRLPRHRRLMRPRSDHLKLLGYRLPTEAEWELAARGGQNETRYFGRTLSLADHYMWYRANSENRVHMVGMLKPNEFGLFDMLGNAHEWCGGKPDSYPQDGGPIDDVRDATFSDGDEMAMRGGSFAVEAALTRAASRYRSVPTLRNTTFGFRVARTIETK